MTKKNANQRVEKRRTKKSSTRRKLRNASLQQKPQASELPNVERLIEPGGTATFFQEMKLAVDETERGHRKQLRQTVMAIYAGAMVMKRNQDSYDEFGLLPHWENKRQRPKADNQDRLLYFALRIVFPNDKASKYKTALQSYFDRDASPQEVLLKVRKRGFENMASAARKAKKAETDGGAKRRPQRVTFSFRSAKDAKRHFKKIKVIGFRIRNWTLRGSTISGTLRTRRKHTCNTQNASK
ncbi:hypothetical protein ACO34A_01685 [Rhizobium sp. ACO-34A]|nr:hypothetical protein [Rhizobium sp. ACO-34A]ATN32520.1 hypothetical protein ACO34A_01685 [Rhizobium sp. ACO-34A]